MKKFIILIPLYNDWKSVSKLLDEIDNKTKNWVSDVSVVAWSSKMRGEEVAAFITVNKEIDKSDIIDFCKNRIASYKVPRDVFIISEFPKNSVGKILKKELSAKLKIID